MIRNVSRAGAESVTKDHMRRDSVSWALIIICTILFINFRHPMRFKPELLLGP